MTTEQILYIDCRKKSGRDQLNRFLKKVPDIACLCKDKEYAPLYVLEDVFKKYCAEKGYLTQGITPYIEDGVFIFYKSCITHKTYSVKSGVSCVNNRWVKTVHGIDMWEVFAKMIIAIYSDIMSPDKEKENGDKKEDSEE